MNTEAMSVFDNVCPSPMEEEEIHPVVGLLCRYVIMGKKPKTSVMAKIQPKAARKYLLQSDRLTPKKDILHLLYSLKDVDYH